MAGKYNEYIRISKYNDNYDLRANLKLLKVLDLLFSLKYFYFSFKVFTSTFRFIYYNKNIYIGISKTKVIVHFYTPQYIELIVLV